MRSGFTQLKVPATPIQDAPAPLPGKRTEFGIQEFTEDEIATAQANWEAGYLAGFQDAEEGRGRQV